MLLEGALVACLAASAVAFIPGAPAVGRACVRQTRGAVYATPQPGEKGAVLADEELAEGYTEIDGIIFEGDFEDDSVKPSLTSLLEDVADDAADTFKLDGEDSFFSIPDYVPTELPDLAAIGSGLESKKDQGMEFMEGELDVNDQKMYKLLGLDVLDEKKARVDPSTFKLPKGFELQELQKELVAKYRKHEKDVGSSAVQVALMTAKVNHLTDHMRANPKDYSTRRGLLQAVNQRRRLLNFMAAKSRPAAEKLAAELGIRYRAPDTYRSKFEKYRFFKNTKSKAAKNMQLVASKAEAATA